MKNNNAQKIFEFKLELLCEYKKLYPNKKIYLTEKNLNMIYNKYTKSNQNNNLFQNN